MNNLSSLSCCIPLIIAAIIALPYLLASGLDSGSESWHNGDRQKSLDKHRAYKAAHPRDCGTSWIPQDGGEAFTFSKDEIKSGKAVK